MGPLTHGPTYILADLINEAAGAMLLGVVESDTRWHTLDSGWVATAIGSTVRAYATALPA